jgi:DNA ligase-1
VTRLAELVEASERVSATPRRLIKVAELATLLRALTPDEIEIATHYLSGEIPQGRIGIGYASLQAAAAAPAAQLPQLSLRELDDRLAAIAAIRGSGSAAQRAQALRELFSRATRAEQQFLLRLLPGELRQGALGAVMVEAIAAAAEVPLGQMRRAVMYSKNLGEVARVALLEGAAALGRFQLELFAPVSPMLAQTAADVEEALRAMPGEVAFEWKMDGARIQVHKQAAEVRIYTRALNDVTAAVPEIAEVVRGLSASALILDGEAITVDAAGRPHPFQITMRRFGRRLNVEAARAGLPIRAFFFDCLRLEEQSIADRPARERFAALATSLPSPLRVPRLITASPAGNRGASWLKIKRAHTLDLVVLAAEWGHGRRSGKLSNLHLGARDPDSGEYVMLGKTFKGLTDAMLEWQTRRFLELEIRRDAWTVYVRPEIVVEVAFSDLQVSTRYPGGLALRLARVKRYREDKRPEDADTLESVRRIHAAQSGASHP